MHELGIVFHIIDTVEQVGRENGVTQVRCVTLDVGQVSGIEDPYLTVSYTHLTLPTN